MLNLQNHEMKRSHNKFKLLELALLLLLVARHSGAKKLAIKEKESHEQHIHKYDANPGTDKEILGSSIISSLVASKDKSTKENSKMPEPDEAKEERIMDVSNKKVPNQRMRNNNFSSIDENYKKVLKESGASNLQREKNDVLKLANPGEVNSLLGSIENSVRKDFVDISTLTRNEGRAASYARIDGKLGALKLRRGSKKELSRPLKTRLKTQRNNTSHRNAALLLSTKKLDSSLSNKKQKNRNKNTMNHNENLIVDKKLKSIANGEEDKKNGEWDESGSGDESAKKEDNDSKLSIEQNFGYGIAPHSARIGLSEDTNGDPTNLSGGNADFTPEMKQIGEAESANKQHASLADEENSDGYFDDNSAYNAGEEFAEGPEGLGSYEADNDIENESYSNNLVNEDTYKKQDNYSLHVNEIQKDRNAERQVNAVKNVDEQSKNIGLKEESTKNKYYGKGKRLHINDSNDERYIDNADNGEKMSGVEMLDIESSGKQKSDGEKLGKHIFGEQESGEQLLDDQAADEQFSGEQTSGELMLNEQISGEQESGEPASGEQRLSGEISGEEAWDVQTSSKQDSREADSGNVKAFLNKITRQKGAMKKFSIHNLMVPRKHNNITTMQTRTPVMPFEDKDQRHEATSKNLSSYESHQSGMGDGSTEMEDSMFYGSPVKKWQARLAYSKDDTVRDNSLSKEGISGNIGKLEKQPNQDYHQKEINSANAKANNGENGPIKKYDQGSNETIQKDSSIDFMNGNATNALNKAGLITLKDNDGILADTVNNHTDLSFSSTVNNSLKEKLIGGDKDDNNLQELNKEIKDEEEKSRAMLSYLEKIDKELGEETNISVNDEGHKPGLINGNKYNHTLSKLPSYGLKNTVNEQSNNVVRKSGRFIAQNITQKNGTIEHSENQEMEKEHITKTQNLLNLKGFQNDTILRPKEEQSGSNEFLNEYSKDVNNFITEIFRDLEQMVESKLEEKAGAESKDPSVRKKKFYQDENYGSILGKIVEKVTRKTLQIKGPDIASKVLHERIKNERNGGIVPFSERTLHKTAIVIDLHDKNTTGNALDVTKRTERPTIDNNGDIILSYKKIYGANSTLVADFSDGEAGAKLYIIPKIKEENAQKKNIVAKNEVGEKRMSTYGFCKSLYIISLH